jgi:hypothetical protein
MAVAKGDLAIEESILLRSPNAGELRRTFGSRGARRRRASRDDLPESAGVRHGRMCQRESRGDPP